MAPAKVIEPKDLPTEVQVDGTEASSLAGQVAPPVLGASASTTAPQNVLQPPSLASSTNEGGGTTAVELNLPGADWEQGLEAEAMSLLVAGRTDVWEVLANRFEARLIQTALANTRGRRIEAAQKLGIGRNTITRKIQELGLDD